MGRYKDWEIERNAYKNIVNGNRREIERFKDDPEEWRRKYYKAHRKEETKWKSWRDVKSPMLFDDSLLNKMVGLVNHIMFTERNVEAALEWSSIVKGYIEEYFKLSYETKVIDGINPIFTDFWSLEKLCQEKGGSVSIIDRMYELWLMESFYLFESYIFYLERYREQEKRFYLPRMNPLKTVLNDLEDLANRKLKFLGISLPSRTGKSTLSLYFLTWLAMKNPDESSAIGSHSGILAKGFYGEVLNIMTSDDYAFGAIYKFWHKTNEVIEDKSSEYLYINLGASSRFATIVFRGIDGTWTGAINISPRGLLVVDDLVRDREHSLSPTRMENTWQEYLNKMVDRKSGADLGDGTFAGACELMIGTLWNVYDPLYRMETLYGDDPLYRFRKIPALNEKDETNFPYQYTTEYLHEMRERLDAPEWMAKWQQAPYVREGLLYQPNELLYFNGECPDGKTIAVLDPAVGGGDNLSMLIIRIAGNKNYIIDWLYTNETKGKTIPAIRLKIVFHNVTELHFERNGIGRAFEEDVTKELHLVNYFRCKSIPFNAPEGMSKEEKILGYSDWVKSNFYFIEEEAKSTTYSRSTDYTRALNDMFIYTTVGKNKHDDSVDNLAQAARMFESQKNGSIDIILNPFR